MDRKTTIREEGMLAEYIERPLFRSHFPNIVLII